MRSIAVLESRLFLDSHQQLHSASAFISNTFLDEDIPVEDIDSVDLVGRFAFGFGLLFVLREEIGCEVEEEGLRWPRRGG